MNTKPVLISTVVIAGVLLFMVLHNFEMLTVSGILAEVANWRAKFMEHPRPYLFVGLFLYTLVMSTPLPLAAVSIFSAGYVFGFWKGLIIITISSLVSASIVFSFARYLGSNISAHMASKYSHTIQSEIKEAGLLYALSLRLSALIPFFILNVALGISSLKYKAFLISTLLGMLPVLVILVNAGSQLIQVEQISDILNVKIMLSFLLVSFLPLLIRLIMSRVERHNPVER